MILAVKSRMHSCEYTLDAKIKPPPPHPTCTPSTKPILSNSLPAPSLGPTDPCPNAVHTEPFSTFSLQFPTLN